MEKSREIVQTAPKALSDNAIKTIKGSIRIKTLIGLAADTTYSTVQRWVNDNSDQLTKESILKVIESETGLTRKQILAS